MRRGKDGLKRVILAAFASLLALGSLAGYADAAAPGLSAAGAVIVDVRTTRVLGAQNAHTKLPMASTTKVMTALVALERGSLADMVKVPDAAYGVEGSSMYLNRGETLSLRDLLCGLLLASGNDAAVTIACHIGGSVEGFVQLMNARARELGCTNTNFVTPNGLHDENHYTTAYDLALISAVAMRNPAFAEIVGTQYHKTTTGDVVRTLKNKNKLLWQYAGGNGVKTGFTKAAGRCLVYSAEREGNTIVGVALAAPDMWNDATAYLDYAFDAYRWEEILAQGEVVRRILVEHGIKNSLEAVAKDAILLPLDQAQGVKPELRVSCPQSLEAPIQEGQVIGSIEAWLDGRLLASTPLVAAQSIMKKEYPYYVWRLIREWTA